MTPKARRMRIAYWIKAKRAWALQIAYIPHLCEASPFNVYHDFTKTSLREDAMCAIMELVFFWYNAIVSGAKKSSLGPRQALSWGDCHVLLAFDPLHRVLRQYGDESNPLFDRELWFLDPL